jgi:hypothetical protein
VGRRAYERQAFVRSRAARRLRDAGSTFGARRSRGAYRRGEGRLLVRHDPARHHHASRVYEMSTSATNRRPCAATPGATSVPAASTDRDRRVIRMPAGRRLHRLTVECGTCRDQPLARHAPSSMRRPPTSRYPSSGGRGSPRLRSPRLPREHVRHGASARPAVTVPPGGGELAATYRAQTTFDAADRASASAPLGCRGVTRSPAYPARSSEVLVAGMPVLARSTHGTPRLTINRRNPGRGGRGGLQCSRAWDRVEARMERLEEGRRLPLGCRCAPQLCLPASQLGALTLRAGTDMAGMTAPLPR